MECISCIKQLPSLVKSTTISSPLPCKDTHAYACKYVHTMHVNTQMQTHKWSHRLSFVMLNAIWLHSDDWLAHFSGFGGFRGWWDKRRFKRGKAKDLERGGVGGYQEVLNEERGMWVCKWLRRMHDLEWALFRKRQSTLDS